MQRRAASPIIAAVKPPQTAISTISNVDSLFVSMPLRSWRPLLGTPEGFETLCVTDAVGIACEGLISVVLVAIELDEYSTFGEDSRLVDAVGTKEYTAV